MLDQVKAPTLTESAGANNTVIGRNFKPCTACADWWQAFDWCQAKFKAGAADAMLVHLLCVGRTKSGKTELLLKLQKNSTRGKCVPGLHYC